MNSLKALLGVTILSALASALPGAQSNSVVNLGYAQYQGISNSTLGITTYYGLQFAAPPVGNLRWQPPVPIENSTTLQGSSSRIINATVPGYQCIQGYPAWIEALLSLNLTQSGIVQPPNEDCLRLDVIVPNSPGSTKLPVVIQIHGGGYTIGSSTSFQGSDIVSYSNGSIIYVQIQYRLGFYGFLNSQAVKANGTANAGLLDQRAALEWVQRNIAAFGGDPTKVTIWGGSAGGGSVTAQMQLYGGQANPPFRAGIAEYPWWQPFHNDQVLEAQYSELLQASGCGDLSCLRSLPTDRLANATNQVYISGYAAGNYGYGDFYAGPSVDGEIIRELPSAAFAAGRYSKVPTLVDRDGFEGAIFSNFTTTAQAAVQPDLATVWQNNSTSFFTRLFQLYPYSDFEGAFFTSNPFFTQFAAVLPSTANNSAYWQRQAIFGDFIIQCPSYYIASAVADTTQPVWKLVFEAGSEVHGATGAFLFGPNSAAPDPTLAAQMKSYWLGFAVNLDPNSQVGGSSGAARPQWPAYLAGGQAQGFTVLRVNQTGIGAVADPDANERCDFFHGQSGIVRN